jgi:hypothetical protein
MNRHLSMLIAAVAAAALAAVPALAGPALDAARASCEIGETETGYLEVVAGKSPSAQARAEMAEVNNGRRAVYQNTARQNSVEINVVAALTAEKQLEKAQAAGECYRDEGGWKMTQ